MKPHYPIMMIDDEEEVLKAQSITLRMAGYGNILAVRDSREVLEILRGKEVDVILLDLAMPHLSGEELLREIKENFPSIPIIVITANNNVETAVNCMKAGAIDYMVKPIEKNRLVSGIKNAVELRSLRRRYDDLKRKLTEDVLEEPSAFSKIVTCDRRMRGIFQYIETIAKTDLTVFTTGETGTGKELIAEAVHRLSNRTGEFVPVNIAGLDDNMLSDTLFGHKKGAFTGASESRKGLIQQAADGTLFIDEIGDLSQASQIKLLRLLEQGEYYSLGSDVRRLNKARLILATQKSSGDLLRSGHFRDDLYYRIATHQINLPPLRERKEDIPLLLHYFVEKASKELGKVKLFIPPELFTLLDCYHFPGNVRELRSMVWDAVIKQEGGVLSLAPFREVISTSFSSCPDSVLEQVRFGDVLPTIKQATDKLTEEALSRAGGNLSIAADLLGISRQALAKRLKRTDG
jgi:DNA-binding NtrC family response regulator